MLERVKILGVERMVDCRHLGWRSPMQIITIERENGQLERRFDNELPQNGGYVDRTKESVYEWEDFINQKVDGCILRDNVPRLNQPSNDKWINHR
jgi:hypothetical protein